MSLFFYILCHLLRISRCVVGGSSIPFIRHYHDLHAGWRECVCVFLCVSGVVCAAVPSSVSRPPFSDGCWSSITAHKSWLMLHNTAFEGRDCCSCTGDMLITTPFSPPNREIALLVLQGSVLHWCLSSEKRLKWSTFSRIHLQTRQERIMFAKTGQRR